MYGPIRFWAIDGDLKYKMRHVWDGLRGTARPEWTHFLPGKMAASIGGRAGWRMSSQPGWHYLSIRYNSRRRGRRGEEESAHHMILSSGESGGGDLRTWEWLTTSQARLQLLSFTITIDLLIQARQASLASLGRDLEDCTASFFPFHVNERTRDQEPVTNIDEYSGDRTSVVPTCDPRFSHPMIRHAFFKTRSLTIHQTPTHPARQKRWSNLRPSICSLGCLWLRTQVHIQTSVGLMRSVPSNEMECEVCWVCWP